MHLFDLTGKTAVITGSSRGIGLSIAKALVAHGANVTISSRNQKTCDAIAEEINDGHIKRRAIAIAASLASKDALTHLIKQSEAEFGGIDILVCNAATNPYYGPLAEIGDDEFRKILDNNVIANHWLISTARPAMAKADGGSVIIISSIGGFTASTKIGAYNISKAADFQLARNYAAELGGEGIRVNCIAPGLIKTDFARALWENPKTLQAHASASPFNRIGEPDEIAGAAVFLASPASTYMTGQTIVIDGGSTLGKET